MRIAVFPTIRDYAWGAPGHCMGELVQALHQAGHQVLWFVAAIDEGHPEVARLRIAGVEVRKLPAPPRNYVRFTRVRRTLDRFASRQKSLADQLEAFAPDHVFVNQGGTWCALQGEFWQCFHSRSDRYSLICHLNQPQVAFSRSELLRARDLVRGARRVFMPSQWVRHLAEIQLAAEIPKASYFQYPMRFDFAQPLPWPVSAIPRLAMVCRLDTQHKAIDCVFEAVHALVREGGRLSLTIYGDGPDGDYLRELARFLRIESCIHWGGYTADLPRVWASEELLILPSRREGSAVALTEAMGFGRPVLTTAVGGASEWVEDGVNGYVCPAAESALLVATLRRALSERGRWERMGRAAHQKISREMDRSPAHAFLSSLS